MRQAIVTGISALLLSVLLPNWLLPPALSPDPEPVVLVVEQPIQKEEARVISIGCGDGVLNIPLETYLVGVVLSEMPASFHVEALKAQAVAARTFTLRQLEGGKHEGFDICADSSCCQAWSSREHLEEKLGESAAVYWERAEQAVSQTRGEALFYDGQLIDAVYFSCSGGSTEDAVAVWGSEVPYLKSVPSVGEETASVFETEKRVSTESFRKTLMETSSEVDLTGAAETWVGDISYTDGGGVESIVIGGEPFKGTLIRNLFGLNSTKFSVELDGHEIVFQVKGYGHRVGLSQYGANAMAEDGKGYREILSHYYTGTLLKPAQ